MTSRKDFTVTRFPFAIREEKTTISESRLCPEREEPALDRCDLMRLLTAALATITIYPVPQEMDHRNERFPK
jgi:hypothetical protein